MTDIQYSIEQNVTNGRGLVEYQKRAGDDTYLALQARLGEMEGVGYPQIAALDALDQTAKDLRLSDKVITPEAVSRFLGIQQRYSSELISLGDDVKRLGISDEVSTLDDVEKLLKMKRYFTWEAVDRLCRTCWSEEKRNSTSWCNYLGSILPERKENVNPQIELIRKDNSLNPNLGLIELIDYFGSKRKSKLLERERYDCGLNTEFKEEIIRNV